MKDSVIDPVLWRIFTRRALKYSSILAAVEGLAGFSYLLLIPADSHSSILLGFSLQRLLILLFFLGVTLALAFLAFRFNRDEILLRSVMKYVDLTERVFIGVMEALEFLALFCLAPIVIFEIKPPAAFQAYFVRMLPLLVWLVLLCLQAILVYSSIHYQSSLVTSIK